MEVADSLLERLEGVRPNGRGRWMARCPVHEDRSPSLSIRETDDGTILLHCFAQCPATDVVTAIGLTLADLFPVGPKSHHRPAPRRCRGLSARETLDAVSHALSVVTLADSALMRGEPLTNNDYEALDNALAVLNGARRAA